VWQSSSSPSTRSPSSNEIKATAHPSGIPSSSTSPSTSFSSRLVGPIRRAFRRAQALLPRVLGPLACRAKWQSVELSFHSSSSLLQCDQPSEVHSLLTQTGSFVLVGPSLHACCGWFAFSRQRRVDDGSHRHDSSRGVISPCDDDHAGYAFSWYGLSVAGTYMTRILMRRG
jgi:cytochrome oxidase assembly protein ShyY1